MATKSKLDRSPKYYQPSPVLIDALAKELQSLTSDNNGPPQSNYRKENTNSKRKYDIVDRIFQSLVDVVYFLEFIEDHPELHDIYENDLKDLFGVGIEESSPQPFHKNNRGGLFPRFIASSIFSNWTYSDGVQRYDINDFRIKLIDIIIDLAIDAIRFRLGTSREGALFSNNAQNTILWSDLLANKYREIKPRKSHRRIGYSIPITYRERGEIRSGERRKTQENLS